MWYDTGDFTNDNGDCDFTNDNVALVNQIIQILNYLVWFDFILGCVSLSSSV